MQDPAKQADMEREKRKEKVGININHNVVYREINKYKLVLEALSMFVYLNCLECL